MRYEDAITQAASIAGNIGAVLELITRIGGHNEVKRKYAEYCAGTLASQRLSLADWLVKRLVDTEGNR